MVFGGGPDAGVTFPMILGGIWEAFWSPGAPIGRPRAPQRRNFEGAGGILGGLVTVEKHTVRFHRFWVVPGHEKV